MSVNKVRGFTNSLKTLGLANCGVFQERNPHRWLGTVVLDFPHIPLRVIHCLARHRSLNGVHSAVSSAVY
jgi:hypothetical protein